MRNFCLRDHYCSSSFTIPLPDCFGFARTFEFFQVICCNFVIAIASGFRLEYSGEATEEAKMVKIVNLSDFLPDSH